MRKIVNGCHGNCIFTKKTIMLTKIKFKVFVALLVLLCVFIPASKAQNNPMLTTLFGKAFTAPALRLGIGFNQLFWQRVGFYYTYEFRSDFMPFETTPYAHDDYKQDLLGLNYCVNSKWTVYGGLGLNQEGGLLNNTKTAGLRKEIGLLYNTPNSPLLLSAGYSFSMGFTANLGWAIPLKSNRLTVHQALTE